jgi:hypothetical protein
VIGDVGEYHNIIELPYMMSRIYGYQSNNMDRLNEFNELNILGGEKSSLGIDGCIRLINNMDDLRGMMNDKMMNGVNNRIKMYMVVLYMLVEDDNVCVFNMDSDNIININNSINKDEGCEWYYSYNWLITGKTSYLYLGIVNNDPFIMTLLYIHELSYYNPIKPINLFKISNIFNVGLFLPLLNRFIISTQIYPSSVIFNQYIQSLPPIISPNYLHLTSKLNIPFHNITKLNNVMKYCRSRLTSIFNQLIITPSNNIYFPHYKSMCEKMLSYIINPYDHIINDEGGYSTGYNNNDDGSELEGIINPMDEYVYLYEREFDYYYI